MVKLVNLSNIQQAKVRTEGKVAVGPKSYYLEEYRNMNVLDRARKAALSVSDNGRCWWVYAYVFRELTWRDKCD